jgi:hypothetical protein
MTEPLAKRAPRDAHMYVELQMRLAKGGAIYVHRCKEYPWLRRMYRREERNAIPVIHWNVEGLDKLFPSLAEAWDAKRIELLREKAET